jgi:hypothetical protein
MTLYTFEQLEQFALKYECEILDSKEYYESMRVGQLIRIKCCCGHNTMETITNFTKYKKGIYCKNCIENIGTNPDIKFKCFKCSNLFEPTEKSFLFCSSVCSHSRNFKNSTKQKISDSVCKNIMSNRLNATIKSVESIQTNGNNIIINAMKNFIEINLTSRCSEYNHIYRLKGILGYPETLETSINSNEKIWCPIEIKYSDFTKDGNYYFTFAKQYTNCIILCCNLQDNKFWLFPPNIITIKYKLKISPNFKYNEYLFHNLNGIADKMIEYYLLCSNIRVGILDDLYLNLNNNHVQIEYEYKLKRLTHINFLLFENPLCNFSTFNFTINTYKIQECVSYICKKSNHQIVSIHKIKNGHSVPYDFEDADFFWINERTENYFYVIPNKEFYERGLIRNGISKGKTTLNINSNFHWLSDYRFSYSNINEDEICKNKLIQMFN